jgi:hypothetical protein
VPSASLLELIKSNYLYLIERYVLFRIKNSGNETEHLPNTFPFCNHDFLKGFGTRIFADKKWRYHGIFCFFYGTNNSIVPTRASCHGNHWRGGKNEDLYFYGNFPIFNRDDRGKDWFL